MRRFFAILDGVFRAFGGWLVQPQGTRIAVLVLLGTHAGLLAYSATRHSPTHLEPAFLASGISHWQFGRFELYRVNPPLPRMVAALPVLAVGCETDWSRFHDGPGARAEFPIGEDFIKANGPASIPLFFYARWACIPFSLIGGFFAFKWANELYGNGAGLFTLLLWTFEPNLLAHAELVTPDCAAWSFGILAGYTFWRWLKVPSWRRAIFAGLALGLAELSKLTWLILFGLWPLLWLAWLWLGRSERHASLPAASLNASTATDQPPLRQFAVILVLALYALNFGYGFDGFGKQLKEFTFISTTLTGLEKPGEPGNRFRDTTLGEVPVLLPEQYVLGFDTQKKDFEDYHQPSYLRGEWKDGGWWYYYLYGLAVKVPTGLLLLFLGLLAGRLLRYTRPVPLRDELILLTPAAAVLVLCSMQTEINEHLRYVFPALALSLVWLGQIVWPAPQPNRETNIIAQLTRIPLAFHLQVASVHFWPLLVLWSLISTLSVYPHQLAYFNDFVGGPRNGHEHLLGSSFDWGQDNLYALHFVLNSPQIAVVLRDNYFFRRIGCDLPKVTYRSAGQTNRTPLLDFGDCTELLLSMSASVRDRTGESATSLLSACDTLVPFSLPRQHTTACYRGYVMYITPSRMSVDH